MHVHVHANWSDHHCLKSPSLLFGTLSWRCSECTVGKFLGGKFVNGEFWSVTQSHPLGVSQWYFGLRNVVAYYNKKSSWQRVLKQNNFNIWSLSKTCQGRVGVGGWEGGSFISLSSQNDTMLMAQWWWYYVQCAPLHSVQCVCTKCVNIVFTHLSDSREGSSVSAQSQRSHMGTEER